MKANSSDLLKETPDSALDALGENENVLWQSKPKLFAIVFRKLVFAFILTIPICFIEILAFKATFSGQELYTYIIVLITIFLSLPIILIVRYFVYIFLTYRKYKNTEYVITDKRIIIKAKNIKSIEFERITSISSFSTPLEKLLGVGNVIVYADRHMNMIECIQYPRDVKLKLYELKSAESAEEKSTKDFVGGDFYKIKEKMRDDFMSQV
ncbi:MAG: PH domain-containing protein, partial [Clostridia bacterium]|nr:PH domain-containing protein [Clostridia bacterium]